MASRLYLWAAGERQEIYQDLKWFNAGATLFSPSGNDITQSKIKQLRARLREIDKIIKTEDY